MSNKSSGENLNQNIQQGLLNHFTVLGNFIAHDINQQNTTNIENQIVIQQNTPQTNPIRALYREIFKALIENRLTLFGGRTTTLARITEFINKSTGGYLVISAPAGFGKTSLMAKLINEAPETFAYHFFAPYENSNSVTEEGFLRNVVEQIAQWHGYTDTLPEKQFDLQKTYHHFLDKPLEHTHVLVIDGLDEVTNWKIAPYLSRRLPDNLHIILTVRDVGQDLALDYDFPKDQTECLQLGGLTRKDVADVLRRAGKGAIIFAEQSTLLDEVMRVSAYQEEPTLGADPFYVRWLAEDAASGRLTPANIATQPKGLEKYLDVWWQDIKKSAGEQPVKDLFGTLTAALGVISRQDLETLNDSLIDDWAADFFDDVLNQVRRFVIGNEERGYAIAHPRLRQYMRTKIKTGTYNRRLLDFCASWQENYSLYALRYYAEHLRDAKQWNDLYAIARNKAFADIQWEKLPDEPDLPLKTIQIALASAAEENNAGLMAEFILRHARWIEQTKQQESPLQALRKGSIERALKLVEIYEFERQILWYLLLAWELKETKRIDKALAILKLLQQKKLLRYRMQNVDWQGNYAAYFLAHLFDISDIMCASLQEKILDDHYRRKLCKYLCDLCNFSVAIDITFFLKEDIQKIWQLASIAKKQATRGDEEAAATFNKALEITRKHFPKTFWLDEMIMIGKEQRDVGYLEAAIDTFNEAHEIAQSITNSSEQEDILKELETQIATVQSKKAIAQSDIDTYEEISNTSHQTDSLTSSKYILNNSEQEESESESTEVLIAKMKVLAKAGNFPEAFAVKDKIKDERRREDAICHIALSLAEKKHYDAAVEFAAMIQETDRRAKIQGLIAIAQAEVNQAPASRTKFAITIQTAQESANSFLNARTLVHIANLQVKKQQREAGIKNAYFAYQIVDKINNLRHKVLILARIAEAFANSGRKDEAETIFDKAKYMLQKTCNEKNSVNDEDADSLGAIALAEARIKNFSNARKTAKNIRFHWTAEVMQTIAKLQAADGQYEEALITLSETLEIPPFFVQSQELKILCTKAVVEAVRDKETAQTSFQELLELARESGKQKDEHLSIIAAALAEAGEIPTALKVIDEIEDGFELVRVFGAITREQFKKGEKVTTLIAAIEAKDKIKDEKKLLQAVKIIAQIQAIAGEGQQAVKTAETILSDYYWHLPGIASLFVETGDKTNFKKLLIPCAYYLDATYEMCEHIARMYPEQAEAVAKVVREFH